MTRLLRCALKYFSEKKGRNGKGESERYKIDNILKMAEAEDYNRIHYIVLYTFMNV